ncbi:MAG: exodeoxyribonuclease VII large subunit [Bacteroidaceae bacterium]|nr:exodeoxyribonuclease VII large subunit [Bacteroidaceae bacterium]
MQTYTLYELNAHVRSLIEGGTDGTYWVRGELLEGREGYGGHFYGELVEKSEETGNVVARARIIIWSRTYNILSFRFREESGQNLRAGIKVLLQVRVTFSELYGYSLHVLDIDGTYTLGDMARRRQEILSRLAQDGIIDDNRTLPLPALMRRIAVVSSATAAGYEDFCRQLQENAWGLAFDIRLFPAVMQGTHVPDSIVAALTAISDEAESWDAVVIIRGGGATGDLSDYDSYLLAACIAQHPLPVITGIGHDRDKTVPDYVAHTSVKTPTAAASFIVDHQLEQLSHLRDLQQRIPAAVSSLMQRSEQHLASLRQRVPAAAHSVLQRGEQRLALLRQRIPVLTSLAVQKEQQRISRISMLLPMVSRGMLEREQHRLELLSGHLQAMDPEMLLRRGYSITLADGHIVTDISGMSPGMRIVTRMQGGEIQSEVLAVSPAEVSDAGT